MRRPLKSFSLDERTRPRIRDVVLTFVGLLVIFVALGLVVVALIVKVLPWIAQALPGDAA